MDTIRIVRARDGYPARGVFRIEGERVVFEPAIPCRADMSDAGLQPSSQYYVEIAGRPRLRVLRSVDGAGLQLGRRYEFETIAARRRERFDDVVSGPDTERIAVDPARATRGRKWALV